MVVGRGVVQLLSYVDLVLASLLAVGGVSALTYGQVLYLLPISLFGMAVAAAELPELSRLGRPGQGEITRAPPRRASTASPSTSRHRRRCTSFAGDVIVGAAAPARRVHGRGHAARVVRRSAAFALGLLGTTRSRLLQNALYALDRPKLVARVAVLRVALAAGLGALLMFPLDRLAIVGSSVQRDRRPRLRAAPRLRCASSTDGPPRLGVVGLALGAALSSWVEYRSSAAPSSGASAGSRG